MFVCLMHSTVLKEGSEDLEVILEGMGEVKDRLDALYGAFHVLSEDRIKLKDAEDKMDEVLSRVHTLHKCKLFN